MAERTSEHRKVTVRLMLHESVSDRLQRNEKKRWHMSRTEPNPVITTSESNVA